MVLKSAPRPRKVLVFVPYIDLEGRPESRGYDRDDCRAEVERWMTELGMLWEWHAITASNLEIKLAYAMHAASAPLTCEASRGSSTDEPPDVARQH